MNFIKIIVDGNYASPIYDKYLRVPQQGEYIYAYHRLCKVDKVIHAPAGHGAELTLEVTSA